MHWAGDLGAFKCPSVLGSMICSVHCSWVSIADKEIAATRQLEVECNDGATGLGVCTACGKFAVPYTEFGFAQSL